MEEMEEVDDFAAAPLDDLQQPSFAPEKRRRVLIVVLSIICGILVFVFLIGLFMRSNSHIDDTTQVWNSIRLPPWQKPLAYDIHLDVLPVESTFKGKVDIHVTLLEASSFFVLHALDLTIDSASIVHEGKTLKSLPLKYSEEYQQFVIPFSKVLDAGQTYVLTVTWHSQLDLTMVGLYRSTYVDEQGRNETVASSHFEATDARRAFPCFDEPELKARFQLTLKAPQEYTTVLFNTPAVSSAGGVTAFQATPLMSTYLVCIVVSKFASVSSSVPGGVPVKTWARPEHHLSGQYSADITSLIVRVFNAFFGVDYPLAKLDLIAIPDFNAGAMENWGLITFRETALLYDAEESGTSGKEDVALTTSHELAHQWFGDLVTMRWWDDVWLNEGFATFVEFQGVDSVHPEWSIWDSFIFMQQEALYADSLSSTHPVSSTASTPAQIGAQFGAIIYSKGGSILRMLKEHLDGIHADSFRIGLQHYLAEHSYDNAATENLWAALSASSGVDVSDMMTEWTKNPGYPVISVVPLGACRYSLGQTRFFQGAPDAPSELTWMIPVRYRTVKRTAHYGQVQESSLVVPETLEGAPCLDYDPALHRLLVLNVNRTGFYRVRYSQDMVRALVADVNSSSTKQSVADVVGLLDDLYAFSKTTEYPVEIRDILDLIDAAFHHPNLRSNNLYQSLIDVLTAIKRKLSVSGSNPVDAYLAKRIAPLIASLGWQVTADQHDENLSRELLFRAAVDAGEQAEPAIHMFQLEAAQKFQQFKAGTFSLHPDLRDAVYRASLKYGGDQVEQNYRWLMARYLDSSTAPRDARRALRALPYATQKLPALLQESLSGVRQQDTTWVIQAVAAQDAPLAWQFLRDNFALLRARFAHHLFTFSGLLRGVCSRLSAGEQQVASFLLEQGVDAKEVAGISEIILANKQWKAKYDADVRDWLANAM